jgi:inositol phosphorylceramide mannosyltransferase catalytic subunit
MMLLSRVFANIQDSVLSLVERREKSRAGSAPGKWLKGLRRKIAYYPISISSLYTEVPQSPKRIPNRVYQTWKRPVLPFLLALEVKRFRRMNPDFSFSFFDDQSMVEYMESSYAGHPILKVFRDVHIPVVRADIWRYCILYKEGGVYCDIKSAMKVPLSQVLTEDLPELISFEGLQWKDLLHVGPYADPGIFLAAPPDSIRSNLECPGNTMINWMLCFEKGNPILEEVINLIIRHASFYRHKQFENVSMAGNHFTGIIAFTQAVWMWMQKTGKRPGQFGVNFSGLGIWKLRGMDYRESAHHSTYKGVSIMD